jgi:mono/diheme cytochrome c family protein
MSKRAVRPATRIDSRLWKLARTAAAVVAVAGGALAGACASTPDSSTWVDDVQPILAANCIRCHGDPPLGGAPLTFRLDVYGETQRDGRIIWGAADMGSYVVTRAVDQENMPPYGPTLSQREKDILSKWPPGFTIGERAGNSPPTASVISPTGSLAADQSLPLVIEVDDADHDSVVGRLMVDAVDIAPLRNGRQNITWNTATLPIGTHQLHAVLDDCVASNLSYGLDCRADVDRPLASVSVMHPTVNGDTAPSFTFGQFTHRVSTAVEPSGTFSVPIADDLVGTDGPVMISFTVSDPDVVPPHVHLQAVVGDQVVAEVAPDLLGVMSFMWDATAVPAGPNVRLLATVTDGRLTTKVLSPAFIVSHTTTADRLGDPTAANPTPVQQILRESCGVCHFGQFRGANGPDFCFTPIVPGGLVQCGLNEPGHNQPLSYLVYRGAAWRKVIQTHEMPPRSADTAPNVTPLSEANRQRLGDWFLAGAPL